MPPLPPLLAHVFGRTLLRRRGVRDGGIGARVLILLGRRSTLLRRRLDWRARHRVHEAAGAHLHRSEVQREHVQHLVEFGVRRISRLLLHQQRLKRVNRILQVDAHHFALLGRRRLDRLNGGGNCARANRHAGRYFGQFKGKTVLFRVLV